MENILKRVIQEQLNNKQRIYEIIRFVLVGLIATGIHYGIYYFLMQTIIPELAYSIGYVVSFAINFILSNQFTFKTKPTIKKGLGFGLSHLINYGLHIFLLSVFLNLGLSNKFAPIPVFIIVIPVNFILVRTILKSSKL